MGTDIPDQGYTSNSLNNRFESQLVVHDLLQFQVVVEAIPSCVFMFQGDRLCYVNAYAESLTGYAREELLNMPFWDLVYEHDQDMVRARGRRQKGADVPSGYDIRFVRKDGEIRWVSVRVNLIELNGKPAVMGVLEDITERRKVESQLREDEGYRRLLFEKTPIGLALCRMDGQLVDVNPAYAKIIGYTHEETLRLDYWDITPEKYADSEQEQLDRLNKTGRYGPYEKEYIHKDGHLISVRLTGRIIERNGERFIWSSVEDISSRKQFEIFEKKTAEILEMIATGQPASNIYDAIALMYESRHPGMRCSMLVLKGDTLLHAGAPSLPEAYCRAVNGLKNGPNTGSCGTSTFTGKRVLVEDIATDPKWVDLKNAALPHGLRSCWSEPVKSSGGEVLGAFGMYYDQPGLPDENALSDLESAARLAGIVMEREERESALRKLSFAVEQAGGSIMITNKEGIIEYINPAFMKITGFSVEEAIGRSPRLLKSGEQDGAFYENMWKTIVSGDVWHGKVIDRRKDGSLFPAMLTISPIVNDEGGISHFVGSHADISELETMEQQFYQAQKMESIGTLVGGIAHDF
ncbi:MAG: PAS domain S-box protein, partial [Mariprofundaceae bacterium]